MENRKNTSDICSPYIRGSRFCIVCYSYMGWKVDLFSESQEQKSWVNSDAPSTLIARPNRFSRNTMFCIWWDQRGVVNYDVLKLGETVNTKRLQQQLTHFNRPLLKKYTMPKIEHKVIFSWQSSHTAKPVHDTGEALCWEVIPHSYSSDLASFNYHLFASMGYALAEKRFGSYEDVKKWLDEWFAVKREDFHWRCIHKLSKNGKNL